MKLEEIYLCIDKYGNQSIKKNSLNDIFANYDDDVVMIKLDNDVIEEIKKGGEVNEKIYK